MKHKNAAYGGALLSDFSGYATCSARVSCRLHILLAPPEGRCLISLTKARSNLKATMPNYETTYFATSLSNLRRSPHLRSGH